MPRKPKVVPIAARPTPRADQPVHNGSTRSMLMVIGSRRVLFEFTSRFRELPPLTGRPAPVIDIDSRSAGDNKE